jgi:hypothetical protein
MFVIHRLILVCVFLIVAGCIDALFFVASYGILRAVRIPVRWVTLAIGWLLIALSIGATVMLPFSATASSVGILMGVFSFGVGIFALGEWVARRWYVTVKRASLAFVTRTARNFYLFVRQHHNFFGWIVLITATAHSLAFLPLLGRISFGAVWSGALAWIVVTLLFGIGLIVDQMVKRKRRFAQIRLWHIGIALAFFAAIIIHIVAI